MNFDGLVDELTNTPTGALLVFLAVFLARVYLDRWDAKQKARKAKKKETHTDG